MGGPGDIERIGRVRLVSVEEMLAIDDGLAPARQGGLDALPQAVEILLERAAERGPHMEVPGLRHVADDVGLGLQQACDAGIVGGRDAGPLRHAESRELGAQRPPLREKLGIQRIGAGIAALDHVDPEPVEHLHDGELVGQAEIDAGRLRAVAQRRVVEMDALPPLPVHHCTVAPFGLVRTSSIVVAPSHSSPCCTVARAFSW